MMSQEQFAQAQAVLGYQFQNPALLQAALTHTSLADDRRDSNERLEFLGDSVMGLVVCHRLYELFPDYMEGELTKIKSAVVSRATCGLVAEEMGLVELILVGKGVMGRHDPRPSSLGANALESIIGAVYLDGGFSAAQAFVLRFLEPRIQEFAATSHQQNFKSVMQQYAQRHLNGTPVYELLDEKGPAHCRCFEIRIICGARVFPSAWGMSKKIAEQKAAMVALEHLGVLDPSYHEPAEELFAWRDGRQARD